MPGKTRYLIFCLMISMTTLAQEQWNHAEVDMKSYSLFQEQKWDELIIYSKAARNNGIDFYYLQARTGIAYYRKGKFHKASEWFLKAWESNKNDGWLQEYLYYSLLYSTRYTEASKVAAQFSPQVQESIGYSRSGVRSIAVEAGFSSNPEFESLLDRSFNEQVNLNNNYGEAFFLKNYHFESLDFNHQVSPGVFFNHNFTFIGINRREQIDWGETYHFPINNYQFQYFFNPVMLIAKRINVSPSINFLRVQSEWFTLGLNADQNLTRYYSRQQYTDFVISASAWYHIGNLAPGVEINSAHFFDGSFTQFSLWTAFYPLSNSSFYIIPRVYFKSDESGTSFNTFGLSGGLQLKDIHFYGQYLNGTMKNFIDPGGYVTGNFPGSSDQKFTGNLYFPLNKKHRLIFRYINQPVEEKYRVYVNGMEERFLNYKYIRHTLTAGILWIF